MLEEEYMQNAKQKLSVNNQNSGANLAKVGSSSFVRLSVTFNQVLECDG
jgi:hypothetical protein